MGKLSALALMSHLFAAELFCCYSALPLSPVDSQSRSAVICTTGNIICLLAYAKLYQSLTPYRIGMDRIHV